MMRHPPQRDLRHRKPTLLRNRFYSIERLEVIVFEGLRPVHLTLPLLRIEPRAFLYLGLSRERTREEAATQQIARVVAHTVVP